MGYKETISRNQVMLVDLENMVAEDSECRVIDIFCETLDMAKLGFKYSEPKETVFPNGNAAARPTQRFCRSLPTRWG